ncbi:MAG: hypothetical protein WCQ64_16995 [Acidobacteriota bacterium]
MAKPKKPRPTFDVAKTEISGVRAGWVYRSDVAPVEAPVVTEPVVAPLVVAPRPVVAPPPEPEPYSQSWFVAGAGAMVLPFSIAVAMVAVPVIWVMDRANRQS